jgi:hypothetical protein
MPLYNNPGLDIWRTAAIIMQPHFRPFATNPFHRICFQDQQLRWPMVLIA